LNLNFRLSGARAITRRAFFGQTGMGLGTIALNSLLWRDGLAAPAVPKRSGNPMSPKAPPLAPRAKSVIYLHMSRLRRRRFDLFDWKTEACRVNLQPCPESLTKGERFAFIKGVAQDARHAAQIPPARPAVAPG